MLELLFCSLITILPDYLYRRYVQGKRIGREITLYSVWFELRFGIVTCAMLTVALITTIFYFHPSSQSAAAVFRTVPILPERPGRISEVFISSRMGEGVKAGQPIFKMDSTQQEAAVEIARRQIAEIDASVRLTESQLATADGQIAQARGAYQEALDELETKVELQRRNASVVAEREVERLQNRADSRRGTLDAALADKERIKTQLTAVLPAQKASADAALKQAEVELSKMTVYAGVDGTVEQFTLRVGDVVNPLMRPGGVLVPADAGQKTIVASFGQLEAQVLKVGMIAEISCAARPFTVIPMVVTGVQDYIASGQLRASDQLIDTSAMARPGGLTVFMEPLYKGGLDGLPPGSACVANAYTSNHEKLQSPDLGVASKLALHAIDTVGVVHAAILRFQALLFPIKALVLSGH